MIRTLTIKNEEELSRLLQEEGKTNSTLVYEGKCKDWCYHASGAVIREGNKFLLNGTKLLHESEPANWKFIQGKDLTVRAIIEQKPDILIIVQTA